MQCLGYDSQAVLAPILFILSLQRRTAAVGQFCRWGGWGWSYLEYAACIKPEGTIHNQLVQVFQGPFMMEKWSPFPHPFLL